MTCDGSTPITRPGNPDCGCGWGDLCAVWAVLALMSGRPAQWVE